MKYFLVLLLFLPLPLLALDIEVRALFNGAALLVIDGESQLLRQGQATDTGIELVEATPGEAIVRIDGQSRILRLSDRISSSFEAPEKVQVLINFSDNRQYITTGSINGRPVRYLVDTGANVVAMNSNTAKSLGLDIEPENRINASTASESVQVTKVIIQEMMVGQIRQNNVQAVVLDGDNPRDILLGMSFLQHVDISENAGLMVLTSKL